MPDGSTAASARERPSPPRDVLRASDVESCLSSWGHLPQLDPDLRRAHRCTPGALAPHPMWAKVSPGDVSRGQVVADGGGSPRAEVDGWPDGGGPPATCPGAASPPSAARQRAGRQTVITFATAVTRKSWPRSISPT